MIEFFILVLLVTDPEGGLLQNAVAVPTFEDCVFVGEQVVDNIKEYNLGYDAAYTCIPGKFGTK